MRLTIDVTQEDIDAALATGRRGYNDSCPIFQAIQRVPELKGYVVGSISLYQNRGLEIDLPKEASDFSAKAWESYMKNDLHLWDCLRPFSFEVELS